MTHAPDAAAIHRALIATLRRVCPAPLPDLPPETLIDSVPDLDSLRLIEAVALLESHYAVTVDTDGLTELVTLADIAALIGRALPGR